MTAVSLTESDSPPKAMSSQVNAKWGYLAGALVRQAVPRHTPFNPAPLCYMMLSHIHMSRKWKPRWQRAPQQTKGRRWGKHQEVGRNRVHAKPLVTEDVHHPRRITGGAGCQQICSTDKDIMTCRGESGRGGWRGG
jgi:hypothetical protein